MSGSVPAPGRFCHGCGQALAGGARFCGNCGTTVESTAMIQVPRTAGGPGHDAFCRACGRAINAMAPICPGCGAPQSPPGMTGDKSRIAAALLAIFLGGFALHFSNFFFATGF